MSRYRGMSRNTTTAFTTVSQYLIFPVVPRTKIFAPLTTDQVFGALACVRSCGHRSACTFQVHPVFYFRSSGRYPQDVTGPLEIGFVHVLALSCEAAGSYHSPSKLNAEIFLFLHTQVQVILTNAQAEQANRYKTK